MLCPDTLQVYFFLEICIDSFDSLRRYFLKFPVSTFNKLSQTERLEGTQVYSLMVLEVKNWKMSQSLMFQDPEAIVLCFMCPHLYLDGAHFELMKDFIQMSSCYMSIF